jgi:hypothetical protein
MLSTRRSSAVRCAGSRSWTSANYAAAFSTVHPRSLQPRSTVGAVLPGLSALTGSAKRDLRSRLVAWIASTLDQDAALGNPAKQVQPKQARGCGSGGGERNDFASFELKMVPPSILSWMEQRADPIHFKTQAGNIGTLPSVAPDTSERKIIRRGAAAVFSTDDVIDLMWRKRVVFMEQAVLATPCRPAGDEQAQCGGNLVAHDCDYD